MKTMLFLLIAMAPILTFAQKTEISKIQIEAKPEDPKKGYSFELIKKGNEVKIYYRTVDSIGKISFSEEDKKVMRHLVAKTNLDSLIKDSIDYFQHKIDSIRAASTYYKIDSATIYKSSHPAYWRYLETILLTPNSVLEKKMENITSTNATYCFFTFTQNNQKRTMYIESLEPKAYPLLTKLVNDTIDVMRAHKQVMEKKH